jgi:hypothetical protein
MCGTCVPRDVVCDVLSGSVSDANDAEVLARMAGVMEGGAVTEIAEDRAVV